MTFPNPGPASQSTGNVAGGPYVAWSGTNTTAQIGPAGVLVPLGAGGGGGVALYDGANSITSGTAQFSNANGVTFGFNGQTVTASVVTSYTQTVQTQASGGIAGSGFTTATTAGTAVVGTHDSNGLSLGVPKYITTYVAGAATGISSIADSANTQTVGMLSFANSHGISFGISTGALTATITASAATAAPGISAIADSANTQTIGTLSFANSNGITFGLSTGANTATLTASFNASQYFFSNSNGISFGSNGSTVTGSYTVPSIAGLISGINVSGGAGTSNSAVSGITFNNSNGVTFGVSTGASVVTVTGSIGTFAGGGSTFAGTNVSGSITLNTAGLNLALSAPAPGAQQAVSYYEAQPWRGQQTFAGASNSIGQVTVMYMQPFIVNQPISMYRGMLLNSASTANTTVAVTIPISTTLANSRASAQASGTWTMGLFSRVSTGTNANSSNIISFASTTISSSIGISITNSTATNISTGTATISYIASIGFVNNIDSLGAITTTSTSAGTSTSLTGTTNASSNFNTTLSVAAQNVYITGVRPIDFALATSLSAGEYWFGLQYSSASATSGSGAGWQNAVVNTAILFGGTSLAISMYRFGASAVNAGSTFPQQMYGSVSSAQTSTTIASNMFTNNSGVQTWFNLMAATL